MMREIRALPAPLELRTAGNGDAKSIAGHIAYQEESQVMRDFWGDCFVEELAAGCFDESIKTRDVVGLWSHDTAQVLGNTKSQTLRLQSKEDRLGFELDLPDTQAGQDAFASVKRGDVDGVSFGMVVLKDKWATEKRDDETIYKRTVLEAELWEISPVAFPAFPANEVTCRSLEKFKEELKMDETKEKGKLEETAGEIRTEAAKQNEDKGERELKGKEERTIPAVVVTKPDTQKEQRAAFNHYLRTGEPRDVVGTLMVSGSGGALAPEDFAAEIIDGLADEVVMRQLARMLPPIAGKSAAYPRRTGGGGAAMVKEGDPIVPLDLTFDQVTLIPKKAAAIVEVSNELLADTGVDIAAYLAQHFTEEIGELLEGQYWNGNATGANLQGILTAKVGAAPVIDRIPTKGAAVDVEDILALWAGLPAKYRKNATFVCNSALEPVLRLLQDDNGQYLMVRDLTDAMAYTLLGRPLVIADEFPGDLTAGTDALMFGDFTRAVYIADKTGIDIQRNDAAGFYSDVTAFRAIFRTDIALALPEALKVLAVKGQ